MNNILAQNLRRVALGVTVTLAGLAGGCSGNGPGMFSTGALGESGGPVAAKVAVDPACTTMAAQIDRLHQDGAVNGLEKAAGGKSQDVRVKRSSLATQAQLNKANSDFIAKCGPNLPRSAAAAAAPAAPAKVAQAATAAKAAVPAAVAKAAAPAVATADAGVTFAPKQ